MTPAEQLVRARFLQLDPVRSVEDGGLLIRGPQLLEVGDFRRVERLAPAGAERLDLGDCLVGAGLVNAHAHLELGALQGAVAAGGSFIDWIAGLLAARGALEAGQLELGLQAGLRRSAETGSAHVADIDSLDLSEPHEHVQRHRFVELLDAGDPERCANQLELAARTHGRALRAALDSAGPAPGFGLSPHAPYTVSSELLSGVARMAERSPDMRYVVHWSETVEELEWWGSGRGPFVELLGRPPDAGQARFGGSLDWLQDSGLPLSRTALIHGNHPRSGEPERLAALGATIVHCPGCHAFFGRGPFPLRRYLDAGVRVALGTDSLVSNDDLDLLGESGRLRRAHPDVRPEEAWQMLTRAGAEFLGLGGEGTLRPGGSARLTVLPCSAASASQALEQATHGETPAAGRRTLVPSERQLPRA